MNNLVELPVIKLEEYDIEVNQYLTYAQIQQIVDSVKRIDMWAERQQSIDMLILYHATNIEKEMLEECGHDKLLRSGLISAVKKNIRNLDEIKIALDYTTSIQRALAQIAKELPNYMSKVEDVMKNGRNGIKKQ